MTTRRLQPDEKLTNAYRLIEQYTSVPKDRRQQEELIDMFYPPGSRTVSALPEDNPPTVSERATSLFEGAYILMATKGPKEVAIIKNLIKLEEALAEKGRALRGEHGDITVLDEKIDALTGSISSQLGSFPSSSDMVIEYHDILLNQ